MRRITRSVVLCIALGCSALALAQGAESQYSLNIGRQSLTKALNEFSRQTHLSVGYLPASSAEESMQVGPLNGRFTAESALTKLLAPTTLHAEFINPKTVAIRREKAGEKNTTSNAAPARAMRLAATTPGQGDGKEGPDPAKKTPQVVIQGQRAKPAAFSTNNLDLTRTKDDELPFTTFDARDIELSGAASLQEFLLVRLPQNLSPTIRNERANASSRPEDRANDVDLRGWGADETVFFLNGRRMAKEYHGTDSDDSNATPNLQQVPIGSIERIEILPSAGSAIYGESATGGVINIITRRDYSGGQLSVAYESPFDIDRPQRSIAFNYGRPLWKGFAVRASGSYSDADPLKTGDRARVTSERWRRIAMERDPGRIVDLSYAPIGATPNIVSAEYDSDSVLRPLFGPGTATFTSVPAGSTGGLDRTAFTPGVYNLALADAPSYNSLLSKQSRMGPVTKDRVVALGIDKDFDDRWQWSLEYRRSDSRSQSTPYAMERSEQFVPAAAPTNPFGQDVSVSLLDPWVIRPEIGREKSSDISTEISTTLRGQIGEWRGIVDLSHSQDQNSWSTAGFVEPIGGWDQAILTGVYNPFVDARLVRPAPASFYEHYIVERQNMRSATRGSAAVIRVSGPVFRLPSGPVQLTVGAEASHHNRYRSYDISHYYDSLTGELSIPTVASSDTGTDTSGPDLLFSFDSRAVYAETTVPVVAPEWAVPLLSRLEIFASGRLSKQTGHGHRLDGASFEDVYRPAVHALGFRYEPLAGLALRVSQSNGFKPPDLGAVGFEDPLPSTEVLNLGTDPRRNNEDVILDGSQIAFGANPDLKPETTTGTNVGVIFMPPRWPQLRLSIDYLESVRRDAITGISPQDVIALETQLPERIRRAPPDGSGRAGRIEFLDFRQINFRQIASKSVDLSLEQRFASPIGGGAIVLTAAVTKNLSFKIQTTNDAPPQQMLRSTDIVTFAQQIQWNGNGQLRWEGRDWSAGWSARYFDYLLVNPSEIVLQGSDRAPATWTHDVFAGYRAPVVKSTAGAQWLLSGLSVTAGVKNVFNRAPRFWAQSSFGIAPYDSILGRSIWLQARRQL